MKVVVMAVGKTATPWVGEGLEAYLKRASRYIDLTLTVVPDVRNAASLTPELRKRREGEALLAALEPTDRVVLLDERGREMTSTELARALEMRMAAGLKRLVLVVGGPYGFSDEVYGRADARLSLSRLTFTHDMARLVIVEQVYRAVSILRGLPYHHE